MSITSIPPISNKNLRRILAPVCMLLCAATALAATITGTVTDRTSGKPSPGDTIAVINTAQGMDEIAKATSDAQGHYSVSAPDGGQILLHITHKGADYFKSVPPASTSVDIDVYDAAAKVDGISGEALVLRAETDPAGTTLNVAENFFVQNTSSPPRTQYGANTFDFFLPKGAAISLSLASAPGGLPTNTPVKTIDAASGHYAFTFPVRPGETRFQVSYTLPYSGKQPFALKLSVPTGDVAVMLPKSMQFQPTSTFQSITPDVNAQSYDDHEPPVAQPVEFAVLGTGQLPQDDAQSQAQSQGNGGADQSGNGAPAAQPSSRPGGGLGPPIDAADQNDPWSKYKWWILSGLGLALVCGAAIMLKGSPEATGPMPFSETPTLNPISASMEYPEAAFPVAPPPAQSALLAALKEELYALESERLLGKLTDAQYAEHKAALDVVLRRALSRIEPAPPASNS